MTSSLSVVTWHKVQDRKINGLVLHLRVFLFAHISGIFERVLYEETALWLRLCRLAVSALKSGLANQNIPYIEHASAEWIRIHVVSLRGTY